DNQVEWMRVWRQRREGSDRPGHLEKDVRSAEVVCGDGGVPGGEVGPASETEIEGLELLRGVAKQRRPLVAVVRQDGNVTAKERGSSLLEAVEGSALRHRQELLRR